MSNDNYHIAKTLPGSLARQKTWSMTINYTEICITLVSVIVKKMELACLGPTFLQCCHADPTVHSHFPVSEETLVNGGFHCCTFSAWTSVSLCSSQSSVYSSFSLCCCIFLFLTDCMYLCKVVPRTSGSLQSVVTYNTVDDLYFWGHLFSLYLFQCPPPSSICLFSWHHFLNLWF